MASISDPRAVNATLTGTTVDDVTITQAEGAVVVVNRDTTNLLWVTYTFDGSTPTTPVAEAEGVIPVPAGGGSIKIKSSQVGQAPVKLKVLGNGGAYTVVAAQQTGTDNEIEITAGAGAGAGGGASAGDVAHDAADSGNPVKVGAQARQTNPTAVADADRTNLIADDLGKQIVQHTIRDLDVHDDTTITASTTETTILAAGGAGVFHDVYSLIITNTSSTATKVTIRDVTGAGTTRVFEVPARTTVGVTLTQPWRQGTANSAWTAQCGTSVSSVEIFVAATKNI